MNSIMIENVSKVYHLYDKPIDRLKESLNVIGRTFHKEHFALKDISLEIPKGETIGIIGKNGSGKSTLLKIITGVLTPTSGNVVVRGKVSALLELGVGFNPEYTGIQNIYLYGSMMGLSKDEMDKKVDGILGFADIGEFVKQPVKTYSSGMFARLAFAVAINVDPEVLIVDETLSVGDIFFQNKCYKKFDELQRNGTTILLVSHDISSIKKYCSKVLWLAEGRQIDFGETEEICVRYYNNEINERNQSQTNEVEKVIIDNYAVTHTASEKVEFPKFVYTNEIGGTKEAEILSFTIKDSNGLVTSYLEADETYSFHIASRFFKDTKDALFGFTMETPKGIMAYTANNFLSNQVLEQALEHKVYECVFQFRLPKLLRGKYLISPAISRGSQENHVVLCWYQNALEIFIENTGYNLALIELDNDCSITEYNSEDIKINEA